MERDADELRRNTEEMDRGVDLRMGFKGLRGKLDGWQEDKMWTGGTRKSPGEKRNRITAI